MQTNFAVNDPLAVKLWSKKLAVQALQQTWFKNFISTDGNNICYMLDDAEKSAGDTINVGLRVQLSGAGVQGDGTLEGQEEALTTYADKLLIDQLRHAVNVGGRITQQRVPFELREEARMGLQDWWANRFDTSFFNQLCGYTPQTDTRFTGNNATIAPTNTTAGPRLILPSTYTSESQLTSTDTFSLSLIDTAVERAYLNNPYMIRPIRIDGNEKYILFISPSQVTDMRTNTGTGQWLDIEKAAATGGEVSNNPIYTGSLGEYNGTIIHKAFRVTAAVSNITSAAIASTARAAFCGAQSLALGFGREQGKDQFTWVEELFDYGNILGVSAGSIFGIKKLVYNSADFGVQVIATYAKAH